MYKYNQKGTFTNSFSFQTFFRKGWCGMLRNIVKVANEIKKPLSLKNDGKLELFFIGTGSAFATSLYQTNFLIIKGNYHILVDFGMTGQAALLNSAGLKVSEIEVILPTHSHADHVGGIECLGLMNRYVDTKFMDKPKIKMIISEEYQRVLWDNTLRGGMEWNEQETESGRKLSFCDYFQSIRPVWKKSQPREVFETNFNGIHLEIFRVKHMPDSANDWQESFIGHGLFIDGKVFVSGDTRFDLDLIDMYKDRAQVIFHDTQFFNGGVHASLEELKTLPDEVKEKMFLMHYSDEWGKQNIDGFAGWAKQGCSYIFP